MKASTKEAGAEDTMVLSQELLQLQKTVWAPHNKSTVFASVAGKRDDASRSDEGSQLLRASRMPPTVSVSSTGTH